MGVKRLLPSLSPLMRRIDLTSARGQVAGIDGHVWLHRAIFLDVVASSIGEATTAHCRYFTTRARRLREYGIQPIFFFDGDDLLAKSVTERNRSSHRTTALARAISLRESGDQFSSVEHLGKAADVSHQMVVSIMRALRDEGFDAYVSPYEADAQLAFLAKSGAIDLVFTEDSDLAVYGCPRIVFKFDQLNMSGYELTRPICDAPVFRGISESACRLACVLAGCDYGPSIHGLGLVGATRIASSFDKISDKAEALTFLSESLNKRKISSNGFENILEHVQIATLIFKHQSIFDPQSQSMTHMNPLPGGCLRDDQLPFLGSLYDSRTAAGVYNGLIHPVSKVNHQ